MEKLFSTPEEYLAYVSTIKGTDAFLEELDKFAGNGTRYDNSEFYERLWHEIQKYDAEDMRAQSFRLA
ncbi:MAG: hypothetical protein LUD51_07090 [Clostridia bacterium]|nr:hypothetical protein [Clostridia bacterium]